MKNTILFILFIFFCLGQLGRIDLFSTNIAIHLNDIVVGLTIVFWLLIKRRTIIDSFKKNQLSKPLFIWWGVLVLSLLVNIYKYQTSEVLVSALYLVRVVVYSLLFFVFSDLFADRKAVIRRYVVLAGIVIGITGMAQYLLIPDMTQFALLEWDDHYYRLSGVFLDPGFTASILAITLLVSYFYKKKRLLSWFSPAIIYSAMALTYARTSYLMFLVGFTIVAILKRSVKIIVIASLILTLTIFILPKRPGEGTKLARENSVFARINNWKRSVYIWTKSPILGVGFNSYRYAQKNLGLIGALEARDSHAASGADSSLLFILATTGVIGSVSFIYLCFVIYKLTKQDTILKIILPTLIVGSFFNNLLFYAWVMELFWILLATRENT